ncbi:MAG: hypothetical protein D6769_01870 [Methanobacteriota archaeon]|nr:MAG: hypothetical protein D6769_01870 [Euryarchaeota archaeon]
MGKKKTINGFLEALAGLSIVFGGIGKLEPTTGLLLAGIFLILLGIHEMAHGNNLCKCEKR